MSNPESKFIAWTRHGDLSNPSGLVYGRDSFVEQEDIIHLSGLGREQLRNVGKALLDKHYNVVKIFTSPSTRAKESAMELSDELGGVEIVINHDLDDNFCPGPYKEKMTMKELEASGGDVYNTERWGKYNHETAEAIVARTHRAAELALQELKEGETVAIISHGDPSAWFLNTLNGDEAPAPQDLRKVIYPAKGEATIIEVKPGGEMKILYTLPERKASERKIY